MYSDFAAWSGISKGAASEGYYVPQGFAILKALYYLSALAEPTPETPSGGLAGQVTLPQAGNSTNAAPTIQQPPPGNPTPGFGALPPARVGQELQVGYQGVQILGGYE